MTTSAPTELDPSVLKAGLWILVALFSLASGALVYLGVRAIGAIRYWVAHEAEMRELAAFKKVVLGDKEGGEPGIIGRLEQAEEVARRSSAEVAAMSDLLGLSEKSMVAIKREAVKRKLLGMREEMVTSDEQRVEVERRFSRGDPQQVDPPQRLSSAHREPSTRHKWDSSWGRKPPDDDADDGE